MENTLAVLVALYVLVTACVVVVALLEHVRSVDRINAINSVIGRESPTFQAMMGRAEARRRATARRITRSPLWPLDAALALYRFARKVKEDSKVG